jgi:pimeloyl-ACP methyl ester carboxylesterase
MRVVVAVSVITGLAAAAAGIIVSAGGTEPVVDGLVLLGFAAGWALLLALSVRFTDHPQQWAAVPAAVMGVGGAALLVFTPSSDTMDALGWVWPPALLGLLAWITTRIRRQLPRRGGRWLLYPVIAVTALAAVGGGYHTVTQSVDQATAESLPGQLIDVGDHRLYLSCTGSGEPTVILEPGLGATSAAWGWIAPTVAAHTRVCVYDRAGRGRSEPSPEPQDGDQIATDLHSLLDRAGVTGPLVMVGHSLGGLYVLDYAARYPQQVAGMVLLDSSSPEQFTAISGYAGQHAVMRRALALAPTLSRFGLGRVVAAVAPSHLPAPDAQRVQALTAGARAARSMTAEWSALPEVFEQAQALTTLGDRPLVVLTASESRQQTGGWDAAQDRLAALSSRSTHRVVDSTHAGQLEDEHGAAASARAIEDVVASVRSTR